MRQFTLKEVVKVVENNGFHFDRMSGDHYIYLNEKGKHISIPHKPKSVVVLRLIKEYNLKE